MHIMSFCNTIHQVHEYFREALFKLNMGRQYIKDDTIVNDSYSEPCGD